MFVGCPFRAGPAGGSDVLRQSLLSGGPLSTKMVPSLTGHHPPMAELQLGPTGCENTRSDGKEKVEASIVSDPNDGRTVFGPRPGDRLRHQVYRMAE